MTEQPLVSICITSHNYARYLPAALDAALGQTYPHVEVVVVDDGSVDESPEVLARYRDRITLEFKEGRGQGSACSRGFELSTGDIVLFHDSDDYLELDAVERIVEVFNDPDVSLCLGRMRDVDENGDALEGLRPPVGCGFWGGDLRQMVADRANFTWPETTGQSYRRKVLEEILPIPDEIAPDFYLSHLAALAGRTAIIERPIACYRVHGLNKSIVPVRRGMAWLENKVEERRMLDADVRTHAFQHGVIDKPPVAGEQERPAALPHDYIRAGLEVAYRRMNDKPGANKWAIQGIKSISTHPQFKVRSRAKHIVWFASTIIAPPSMAKRLVESRYPFIKANT